jgi:hypothetical protein
MIPVWHGVGALLFCHGSQGVFFHAANTFGRSQMPQSFAQCRDHLASRVEAEEVHLKLSAEVQLCLAAAGLTFDEGLPRSGWMF